MGVVIFLLTIIKDKSTWALKSQSQVSKKFYAFSLLSADIVEAGCLSVEKVLLGWIL